MNVLCAIFDGEMQYEETRQLLVAKNKWQQLWQEQFWRAQAA